MAGLTVEETTWLERYKSELAERFPGLVEEIILFGSKARGDAHEDSDIDLLVIIREGDRRLKREMAVAGHRLAIGTYAAPSIMIFTRSEYDSRAKKRVSLIHFIETEGVALL